MPDGQLHSWLIQPHVLWLDWSESAEKIHGIARDTLEKEGTPISEVVVALNELLTGQIFCDAWAFDSFWLHRLFKTANVRPTFQLESISMLLDAEQIQHWSEFRQIAIEKLGLPVHRAANDAKILHKTWEDIMGLDTSSYLSKS
jgi:DNA polymerase III epsilon subunit-like protein